MLNSFTYTFSTNSSFYTCSKINNLRSITSTSRENDKFCLINLSECKMYKIHRVHFVDHQYVKYECMNACSTPSHTNACSTLRYVNVAYHAIKQHITLHECIKHITFRDCM